MPETCSVASLSGAGFLSECKWEHGARTCVCNVCLMVSLCYREHRRQEFWLAGHVSGFWNDVSPRVAGIVLLFTKQNEMGLMQWGSRNKMVVLRAPAAFPSSMATRAHSFPHLPVFSGYDFCFQPSEPLRAYCISGLPPVSYGSTLVACPALVFISSVPKSPLMLLRWNLPLLSLSSSLCLIR